MKNPTHPDSLVGRPYDSDEGFDCSKDGQQEDADDEKHPAEFVQPIGNDVVEAEG